MAVRARRGRRQGPALDAARGDRVAARRGPAARDASGSSATARRRPAATRSSASSRADDGPVDACVVLDGWMKRRNPPELVVATRGLVALDVEVRTGERDLHSGHYGGTALNAIHALAQALTALFPRDGRLPEPLRAGVTPPSDGRARGLAASCRQAPRSSRGSAPSPLDEPRGRGVLRPRVRRALARRDRDPRRQAGPAEHDARLAASAGITIRVAPGQDPEVLAAAAERLLREALPAGATLEIESRTLTPPAVAAARHRGARARRGTRSSACSGRGRSSCAPAARCPSSAALAAPRDPDGHGRARPPRQPHALAERADAASRRSRSVSPPRGRRTARSQD